MTARWRDFLSFQIARNRRLHDEAQPGISMLDSDGRFAIAAAGLYRAILTDIEAAGYDNFSRRAFMPALDKASLLPRIWWRGRGAKT